MKRLTLLILLCLVVAFGAAGTYLFQYFVPQYIASRSRVDEEGQVVTSRAIGGAGVDNPAYHPWVKFKNYSTAPSTQLETGGVYFDSGANCTGGDPCLQLYYDAAWNELTGGGGGGGGAPTDATYLTQTADATLSAEQALSELATGLVKVTTGTGVLSTATAGTDYVASESDPNALLSAGTDNVNDTHINWGTGAGQVSADDISDGATNAIVTLTQESNWETAYSWGDHSGQGYLTTETDPDLAALDTEAELETHLSDVADVFTNNDGALTDDDVTLTDVQNATSSDFHNIGGTDDDSPEIGDTIGSGTSGSVLFVDASTQLAQDNTNFFWDTTNKILRLGSMTLQERSSDPANPAEGRSVEWQSDGTATGTDGQILRKITAAGVTKTLITPKFNGTFVVNSLDDGPFFADEVTTHNVAVGDDAGHGGTYSSYVGEHAGQNNAQANVTTIGYYAGGANTGAGNVLIGSNAGSGNSGSNTNIFGYYAGSSNSGTFSNLFGYAAGQYNSGSSVNLFGYQTGIYNTGLYANMFGFNAGFYATSHYSDFFGYKSGLYAVGGNNSHLGKNTGLYVQGDNATSIGAEAFNTFNDNTGGNKTFDYTAVNPTGDIITIPGHGFGATNAYVNLKYTQGTGPITGLVSGTIYKWKITDANTLTGFYTNITAAGTGTGHTFTPQYVYTNSTAIGYDAEPDASNQVVLGDTNVTMVKSSGNLSITGTGTNSLAGNTLFVPPTAQTIAAGNTITANACGGLKQITSAGAVTTSTTNTFTAPAAANTGCCMDVVNTGANNITLDNNANFKSTGAADVVMTADDAVRVCSNGTVWYQITALNAN